MRHIASLISLFLLLFLGLGFQTSADPATSLEGIDRLIARLGSSDFAEREKAMTALVGIGSSALDALREAGQSSDPEIRRRADELVQGIERREAGARLLAGNRVRLSFQNSPLDQAIKELCRLTGFRFRIEEAQLAAFAESRITLQTEDVTCWEAFDLFCSSAGLVVTEAGSTAAKSATLVRGSAPHVPVCYNGAIRIRALAAPEPGWGRTVGANDLILPLNVVSQASVIWHGIPEIRISRAVDDRDQELEQSSLGRDEMPETDDVLNDWLRKQEIGRGREAIDLSDLLRGQTVSVRLKMGPQKARLIKTMQGTLIGQVDSPPESLAEVRDLLKASGQKLTARDGSVLKIGEVEQDESGQLAIPIHLQTELEDLPALAMPWNNRRRVHQVAMMLKLRAELGRTETPQFQIRDTDGNVFEIVRYNEARQSNGNTAEYSATLHALPPAKAVRQPVKLILIGKRTVTVEVPFTLKDIPLP